MKKHINIIIFVTLFISTVSIIAILIARGYNLAGNEIKESGILNIESKPKGAKITINGESKGTTPDKIELISGKYEIKIAKDGYSQWQKEIHVEPGIVSDLTVSLFPEDLKLEQITFTNIDKAFFSDTGDIIIYTILEGNNKGIWETKIEKSIFDIASSPSTKLSDIEVIPEECLNSSNYDIQFSQTNTKIILSCNLDTHTLFKLINAQNPSEEPINLNSELGFNPSNINFAYNSDNLLITNGNLYLNYNIGSKAINFIKLEENKDDFIYAFIKDNLLVLEYNYDKSSRFLRTISANLNRTDINLSEEIDITRITGMTGSYDDSYIAINADKTYILDIENFSSEILLLSENTLDIISWSPDGKSLLYIEGDILKSAFIKELPDDGIKLEISNIINNYNNEENSIKWNHNSEQLVVYNTEDQQIYSIYKDGTNKKILFNGSLTNNNTYVISENETFLVILTQDEGINSNLYSVKLAI